MAQSGVQRREMVRVDDFLEISHRKISPAESETLSREITDRSSGQSGLDSVSSVIRSAGRTVDPDSPTWRAIALLDQKLDYLISLLQTDNHSHDADFIRCGVNVSGSGIRFPSQQMYEKGDLLWIAILFPISPPLRVEAVAHVARAAKSAKLEEKLPGAIIDVSSKFIAINPRDKEEILRYTFQRQREVLRARRDD